MRGLIVASALALILTCGIFFSRYRRGVIVQSPKPAPSVSAIDMLRNPVKVGDSPHALRTTSQIIFKSDSHRPFVRAENLVFKDCVAPSFQRKSVIYVVDGEFVVSAEDTSTGEDYTKLIPSCKIQGAKEPRFRTVTGLVPGRPRRE